MKKYFEHLRPMERRLVIGTLVAFFLVMNGWLVWPHFSDLGNLTRRYQSAQAKLGVYQTAVAQIPKLQGQVDAIESSGDYVALEDQSIDLMRTIQEQASSCGVGIQNYSRQTTRTNSAFFVDQLQNISVVATEEQLVNFLYKLGSSASMIRVLDLDVQPDAPHYHLNANIQLVASYQKTSRAPAAPPKPATTPAPAMTHDSMLPAPVKPANIFGSARRATNSTVLMKK